MVTGKILAFKSIPSGIVAWMCLLSMNTVFRGHVIEIGY